MTINDPHDLIANRDKRPRYTVGQRVQLVAPTAPPLDGWQGIVRSVSPMQYADGYVLTYTYHLEMDNLIRLDWLEEKLASVDHDNGEEPSQS